MTDTTTAAAPLAILPGRSKTEALAAALRQRILDGEFDGDGGRMPSEHQLCAEYEATRQVVRPAYDRLVTEGLVTRVARVGYFVHRINPVTLYLDRYERGDGAAGRDGLDQWETAIAEQGRTPYALPDVYILSRGAPDEPMIRELLAMTGSSEEIIVRSRTCFVDGIPFMTRDSYFPEPIARGTILMKPGDQVAPGGLLAAIGRPAADWDDVWRARMPTPTEIQRLQLPQVTPGIHWIRTRLDADGVPLAVMSGFLPGDRVQLAEKHAAR